MVCHLLKRLRSIADLELTVILLNEGRLSGELRDAGLHVQVVDENRQSFPQIANAIRKIVSSHTPDIIHSHRYKENILAFLASRFYRGARLIATQHGLPETQAQSTSWTDGIKSKANFIALYRYFQKTVAVSGDIRSYFVNELGFGEDQVEVIHNGIEMPPDVSGKATDGTFVIGSSGRLFPIKDYPLMVSIAREMATKKDVCFVLAGDGPEREALEKAIGEYRLSERFALKGHLEDMDSFYRGLDLFLNTSMHEGFPMTVLEAMARRLPVIAPQVGGIGEIIEDGVEGFLLPNREPKAFAEKCLELQNDELRRRMGQAAREKVEGSFSAEIMARKYYRLYRELAG